MTGAEAGELAERAVELNLVDSFLETEL